jgi:hypothetical protein
LAISSVASAQIRRKVDPHGRSYVHFRERPAVSQTALCDSLHAKQEQRAVFGEKATTAIAFLRRALAF